MAQHAYAEISAALGAIVQPNSVFEIRLLTGRKHQVDGGYFDNIGSAATALCGLERHYPGIYITPNPVRRDLLARSANRIKPFADNLTYDPDVERRLWLLIDVDPIRPSGISSTNTEHTLALTKAKQIAGLLDLEYGWCEPMLNSSGNGAHIMYPMNEPNTQDVTDSISMFLKTLHGRFSDDKISVDTSVFNAARIWRLPGTWARKGDSTEDRPHRKASILKPINHGSFVTIEQVRDFNHDNEHYYPTNSKGGLRKAGNASTNYVPDNERKYSRLNRLALERVHDWVEHFFPAAIKYKEGYRVSSLELGRDREEDLTIHPLPMGIKDFGTHDDDSEKYDGKRTPISVLAEFCFNDDTEIAANSLATQLRAPLTEFDLQPLGSVTSGELADLPGTSTGAKFDVGNVRSYTRLSATKFRELRWVIPNVLPAGAFILAARPKMRKTWLAIQLGCAIASGAKFLDWQCEKSDVLFLGLEDNERRIKDRIDKLYQFEVNMPDLAGFNYFTNGQSDDAGIHHAFPRGDDGVEALERILDANPRISTIFIDTFAHYRNITNMRDIYQRDYEAMMPLTKLAARREVLLIVVHHERKGLAGSESGDFLEDVSGSAGLTGGVDGVISIKGRRGVQDENESRKLLITGRDVPFDYDIDMAFEADRGGWRLAARQDTAVMIKALFQQYPFLRQTEIFALMPSTPRGRIQRVLMEMQLSGSINQTRHGYQMGRA